MPTDKYHFYITAAPRFKNLIREFAESVEQRTGWECTARWLDPKYVLDDIPMQDQAANSVHDLGVADAIVVMNDHSRNSFGQPFFEMGYAHRMGIPIILATMCKDRQLLPYASYGDVVIARTREKYSTMQLDESVAACLLDLEPEIESDRKYPEG